MYSLDVLGFVIFLPSFPLIIITLYLEVRQEKKCEQADNHTGFLTNPQVRQEVLKLRGIDPLQGRHGRPGENVLVIFVSRNQVNVASQHFWA